MKHDIAGLMAALPDIRWVTDAALVRQRSRDFFWYSPVLKRQLNGVSADVVAEARDEADVVRILAACHARRIPVTPRGAGTGNYGQAMPLHGGVVLDVSALDKLLWAKPGVMRAQAGAKLIALDEQTRQQVGGELRFHPSTKRTATIGGFVAGGSAGAGSCMWGSFREPGNVLGLRVITMEATPRILELRGAEIEKANHAYGTNGIITEVEMPLAPAYEWVDVMMAFPSFMEAARFAEAVTLADGIVKKLATVVAAPVPQQYFRHFEGRIPAGKSITMLMIAAPFLEAFEALKIKHGATEAEIYRSPTEEAAVPLYEHAWNHTTLQALKLDRGITYLQTLFPPPGHMALVEKMEALFGDEVPMHLEFVRFGGHVTCFGLQLVRYTSDERLAEIIRIHETNGCPVFNPHAFSLEEGGMKRVDARQLAFKKEADPLGLLNPGKMLAWDDPEWSPDRPRTHYMYGDPDAPEMEERLDSGRLMRVLLIHCHPRAESFSAALRDAARSALEASGHQVECRDLYAEGFAPALSDAEHRDYLDPSSHPPDVAEHVAALQRADALLLVYPTWWYGLPAMLKGWFDRIWAPGVAFRLGDGAIEPLLRNIKRIGVVTTYGSPLWLLWVIGWPDKKLISRGLKRLCARDCRLEWLMLTRMDQRTAPERAAFMAKVKARLGRW